VFTAKAQPMPGPISTRPTSFRTAGISPRKPTRFSYRPDAEERAQLATDLGLLALYDLDFTGEITPSGRDELVLAAKLAARVDQACVVTLAPVGSTVSDAVRRRYVAGLQDPAGDEAEMPEDDTIESLPEVINVAEVAAEALALALPLYPRAKGAELGEAVYAGDGLDPLKDSDLKPFAGLAGLADRLSGQAKPGSDDEV
jgi:uncharacterized metal-binding protein YceD (DUF177 family)